jgi:hypothetical protein
MGLKQLYDDIRNELKLITNDDGSQTFKYFGIWNNQLRSIRGEKNDWISIQYPSIFTEIIVKDIEQQGCKHQLWNIDVNFHVVDDFYNNVDGNFEENTRVFDTNDKLWHHMQNIKIPMCALLVGSEQTQEFDHDNVYHYIQSFKTNYEYLYTTTPVYATGVTLTLSANTTNYSGLTL